MKKIYLAAPFFNPQEVATLEFVEKLCFSNPHIKAFSPRKNCICPPQASMEVRKKTYLDNILAIQDSNIILAGVDFADTGTAWEMGFARALRIPVVAYTLTSKKINLMLAQGVDGVLQGEKAVERFLQGTEKGYDINMEVAQEWLKEIY